MLIFHEGLPGSGKSFEAMVRWLVPAVQKGRRVIAHVNGINHDRIAECSGVPVDSVRELVTEIDGNQVREIWKHCHDNALVIIDELQDYFPTGRTPPSKELSEFVSRHRHQGLDIVCMGQALKDCHVLWRRRVDRKIQFETRDVLGKPQDYTWRAFKLRDPGTEKWELVQTGKGTYDPKFFGMYKSVSSESINTERLGDSRIVVWQRPLIKYGIPLFLVAGVLAVLFVFSFFNGDVSLAKGNKQASQRPSIPAHTPPVQAQVPVVKSALPVVKADTSLPIDPFDEVLRAGRPRLTGVISMGGRVDGLVEVYDGSYHVIERFRLSHAQELGWFIAVRPWGVDCGKNGRQVTITQWPIDPWGRVPQETTSALRDKGRLEAASDRQGSFQPQDAPPSGLIGRGSPASVMDRG